MRKMLPVLGLLALWGCSDSSEVEKLRRQNAELRLKVTSLEYSNSQLLAELRRSQGRSPLASTEALEAEANDAVRRANAKFNKRMADLVSGEVPPPEGF
ncbi:MAG: hypothetical protein ACKO01_02490 [Erythrobacter sp.]